MAAGDSAWCLLSAAGLDTVSQPYDILLGLATTQT